MPAIIASKPLTPSELVLLHGEHFAKEVGRIAVNDIGVELLHRDAKVSSKELARAVLAVAFLANEEVGALRLEVRPKKIWFGLRTVQALYAVPGEDVNWPQPSFEGEVRALVARGTPTQGREVSSIVYELLEEDAPSPWHWAVTLLHKRLQERGLLDTEETRRLKVFTDTRWVLPQSTRALATEQAPESIQQLLSAYEREQPEKWKLLGSQIENAMSRRTERDSDSDFDSSVD